MTTRETPPAVVEVYAAADSVEAHALTDWLAAEGVEAQVVGDGLGAIQGAVPFGSATSPRIWVTADQEAQARKLIAHWQQSAADEANRTPSRPFQYGTLTLLVNLTVAAVMLAILRGVAPVDRQSIAGLFVTLLVVGNLAALAYIRKKRRKLADE